MSTWTVETTGETSHEVTADVLEIDSETLLFWTGDDIGNRRCLAVFAPGRWVAAVKGDVEAEQR